MKHERVKRMLLMLVATTVFTPPTWAQTFDEKLAQLGIVKEEQTDWSEASAIEIAQPNCAYVNITNISSMPTTKTADLKAYIEVYDCNGNYFKKRVILNAQGNSSLGYKKKNFAIDFCEDDWIGDATTDITFGDWVPQDSYHFKAYYTEYFRGAATVGYKLYDQISKDRGRMWTRASAGAIKDKDLKVNARCYPDGFPAIVYLNGEFYGVFAWQLKKHRDNMNMKKGTETHIHLDGNITDATLWKGTVDWSQFEVRNPKTLYSTDTQEISETKSYSKLKEGDELTSVQATGNYTVSDSKPSDLTTEQIAEIYGNEPPTYLQYSKNGNIFKLSVTPAGTTYVKYDGDSPKELVDETMAYYDAGNSGHVLSNQVKTFITTLSGYYNQLKELQSDGAANATMKAKIEEWFDVPGIIDYICFHYAVNNYDGFGKNWQWLTYDGVKWFVAPYDLDGILGNMYTGNFIIPADFFSWDGNYKALPSAGPVYWVKSYYWEDIKSRYADLRDNGILTTENIYSIVENWYHRVMPANLDLEKAKWPDSPCYGETVCNENWTTDDDWTSYRSYPAYSDATTYQAGDKCTLSGRIWTATGETTGVKPYSKIGHTDSPERVYNWLERRFELEDEYLGYTIPAESKTSYTLQVTNAGWATICVPFAFEIPEGMTVYTVSGIQGENNSLEKEAVETKTEANKPYLIKGTPGFYLLTGYAEAADETDDETYLVNRMMRGTYETTKAPVGSYVLQNQNGRLGFYPVKSDNITVMANRAWLVLPDSKAPKAALYFDDMTTGIGDAPRLMNSEQLIVGSGVYDLQGRKLSNGKLSIRQMKPGLHIVKHANGTVTKQIVK